MFKKVIVIPIRHLKVRQIRRPNLTPAGRDVIESASKIKLIERWEFGSSVISTLGDKSQVYDKVNLLMLYLIKKDFYAPEKGSIIAMGSVTCRIFDGEYLFIWLGDDIVFRVKGKKITEYMHKENLYLHIRSLHPLNDNR